MYELLILGLLLFFNAHGYLMAEIVNDMIGPYARLSNGTLYPLLAKLEQRGLIVAHSDPAAATDDRRQKIYAITDAGRQRFHQDMLDTTSNPTDYQRIFQFKLLYFSFLTVEERRYLLDQYVTFCHAHLWHLKSQGAEFSLISGRPPILARAARIMEHLAAQWQAEIDWIAGERERLLADHSPPKEHDI